MRQIFRTTRQRQTDLSRDGGIVLRMNAVRIGCDARLARIRIFANCHSQRQLTKQRHMVVFAHRLRTACAENRFFVTTVRADVQRHILNDAEHRKIIERYVNEAGSFNAN